MSHLPEFLLEFVGTFFFLSIVFHQPDNPATTIIKPFAVVAALFAVIYLGNLSIGHYNPAVTIATYLKDPNVFGLSLVFGYIISQLIGAACAVKLNHSLMDK